ncbi:MAG TPA: hypothetical protein ENN13_00905, partial [Candidatus Altiarchaeales archaeon]|nr:hypothetical protein [Candidatus Altiarchaeales archaeon]
MKAGWLTTIALIILLFTIACSAQTIRSVEVDDEIEWGRTFDVEVEFRGNTQNTRVEFYVEDYEFEGSIMLAGAENIKVVWDKDDWDLFQAGCGERTLRIELWSTSSLLGLLDSKNVEIQMGNVPKLTFTPVRPLAGKDVTVMLKNSNGNPISGVEVKVTGPVNRPVDSREYSRKTDSAGKINFEPNLYGLYKLTIKDRDYCGEAEFYVKEEMIADGPHPSDPVVGEPVKIAVKPGVGVIILDSDGNVFSKPPTNIEGGCNFTINTPGAYSILVGNTSTRYWSLNRTLTVYDKPVPEVKFTPQNPVVGQLITISLSSRGSPLDNALVNIKKPDGTSKDYVTDPEGKIIYDSAFNTGRYTIKIVKSRYQEVSESFEVYHLMDLTATPADATVLDEIMLNLKDEAGHPVENALVEISEANFRDYTDSNGRVSVKLTSPKSHGILVQKTGFWNKTFTITPLGVLNLLLSSENVEVGEEVEVRVIDSQGKPTNAEINILNPLGIASTFNDHTLKYTPSRSGNFEVRAGKTGYSQASKALTVRPHPTEVSFELLDGMIMVKAKSNGNPVKDLSVKTIISGGKEEVYLTDSNGQVSFRAFGTGDLTVELNDVNGVYESKQLDMVVVKDRNYLLLILPILFIGAFTLALLVVIQYVKYHTRSGGG